MMKLILLVFVKRKKSLCMMLDLRSYYRVKVSAN